MGHHCSTHKIKPGDELMTSVHKKDKTASKFGYTTMTMTRTDLVTLRTTANLPVRVGRPQENEYLSTKLHFRPISTPPIYKDDHRSEIQRSYIQQVPNKTIWDITGFEAPNSDKKPLTNQKLQTSTTKRRSMFSKTSKRCWWTLNCCGRRNGGKFSYGEHNNNYDQKTKNSQLDFNAFNDLKPSKDSFVLLTKR